MKRNEILIEADELLTKIDDPNVRIYDATILFFAKKGDATAHDKYLEAHIPGAAFFDHQQFSDANSQYMYMILPEQELGEQIGKIGIDENSEVVVYTDDLLPCATRAWWILRYAGHNNVRVLNGGLAAWKAAGGAIEQSANEYEPTTFKPSLCPEMFASKEDVQSAMENDGVCAVVNTLTSESYAQGHITGSSLNPISDLMTEMSGFQPDEKLAEVLKKETEYERVITYCGGGIAATTSAIAHLIAGNKNVAVYDGSMNEWAGEGLPVSTVDTV